MLSFLVGLFGLTTDADVRFARIAGALGGAFLGFLPYNFPKARIYLGDAGSHVAGFFLAGRFPARSILPYLLSQTAGALLASLCLRVLFPVHATLGATLPAGSSAHQILGP